MTFFSNLTAIFPRVNAAVQSKPVFRATPTAAPFEPGVQPTAGDSYTSNPVYDMLGSKEDLYNAARSSKVIRDYCKQYDIPLEMNFDVLEDM